MKLITTLTSMAAFSMLTATSQATIFWTFTQDGNNVKVSVTGSLSSGSFTSPQTYPASNSSQGPYAFVRSGSQGLGIRTPSYGVTSGYFVGIDRLPSQPSYSGPSSQTTGGLLTFTNTSSDGSVQVGWSVDSYGDTLDSNDIFDCRTVFANRSLSDFGFTPTKTSYVLYAPKSNPNDYDNSVVMRVIVNAPEPSTVSLSGLGFLFVLARRKR